MGKATQTTSEGWTLPIWRNRAWASLHKSNFKFSLHGSISKRAKVPWQGPPMRTPSSSAPLLCGLLKARLIIQTLLHTKHRVCTVASFGSNAAGRGNVPFLPDDVSNSSARVRSEVWSLPAARFCSRPRHVAGVGIGSEGPGCAASPMCTARRPLRAVSRLPRRMFVSLRTARMPSCAVSHGLGLLGVAVNEVRGDKGK